MSEVYIAGQKFPDGHPVAQWVAANIADAPKAVSRAPARECGAITAPTCSSRPNRVGVMPGRREFVELPVPPSTNNLYVNVPKKGRVKSKAYREWIEAATWCLEGLNVPPTPVSIRLIVCAGEGWSEARDVSNTIKPCEDLIVSAGMIPDDRCRHVRRVTAEYDPTPSGPNTRAVVRVQVLACSAAGT